MQFSFTIQDQTGSNADLIPLIASTLPTAGTILSGYLAGTATTNVAVYINTSTPRAGAAPATTVYVETINGIDIFQSGAARELIDGNDGGVTTNIVIHVNPDYLRSIVQFDASLNASNQSPSRVDFVSTIEHELIHGFAFTGYRDGTTGALPGSYETPFDRYVDAASFTFGGPWTLASLGSPVPLTHGNIYHYGNQSDLNSEIVQTGIMNGLVFYTGRRYSVQLQDIVMMLDSDVPLQATLGTSSNDVIAVGANHIALGGAGDDWVTGGSGADLLSGGIGNDILAGGSGRDALHGGPGFDVVTYQTLTMGVTANLTNQVLNAGGATGDVYTSIEGLIGTNFADSLVGDSGDNVLTGSMGDDTLRGDAGNDTAIYASHRSQYDVLSSNGSLIVAGGSDGFDQVQSVERISFSNLTLTAFPSSHNYIASYDDLIVLIGNNSGAGFDHFLRYGYAEGRHVTFNGLQYIASYSDLANSFGVSNDLGAQHFIQYGRNEGRHTSFVSLEYIASYSDLMSSLGADVERGAAHFIQWGRSEGRSTSFNALEYVASYGDLINSIGADDNEGAEHFIQYGRFEGRGVTFDGLKYIASYGDLIISLGANENRGASHFIQWGSLEGRTATFDPAAYLANYADLQAAYGSNLEAAAIHYITYGFHEGRDWT